MINIFITLILFFITLPSYAQLRIFACEPEWASLSNTLGGDWVKVYSATTAQQDVHQIQARPSLIAQIRRANLVVCTGAELEVGWLPLLLKRSANRSVQPGQKGYFMAAEQVERLGIPESIDRSMGDIHAGGNPHVHLDPRRLLVIAEALALRLSALDPGSKVNYISNLKTFKHKFSKGIADWEKRAKPLRGLNVVVHHANWDYLLDWLSIEAVATLEPKPGLPPTAFHLAHLKSSLHDKAPAFILRTPYQSRRPAQWLSEQTSIPVVMLPYTVGGTEEISDLFTLFDVSINLMITSIEKRVGP